jgi:DNA repair protein RadD
MSVTLRPYQTDAAERVRNSFRIRRKAVLLVVPTGGGKTVIFAYVTEGAARKGNRVLVVAHRRELIRQASRKLADAGVDHGIIAPGFSRTNDPVQVASIQTIGRRPMAFGMFDLIIIDEAHHSIAGSYVQLIAAQPQAKLLGVTATPERADGRGLGISVGGVFDDMVLGPSVQDLVDGGYVTPARVFGPAVRPDLSGVRIRGGDYEKSGLEVAMDVPTLTGDAVSHYARHVPGQPNIAFCVSVQHAKNVAATFRAAGWRAFAVDGTDDADYRDRVINGLATGETQVLCTCDLISEGLDVPAVSAVSLLRPTQSLGLYLQQVGRGLRPAPGKTHLTVLDHAGCVMTHGLPEDDRTWSLTGREKKAPPPAIKQCPTCFTIHKPAQACPACGHCYAKTGSAAGRELQQVEGDLMEISAEMLRLRTTPLAQLLTGQETRAQLEAIRQARGYKPSWVWNVLQDRRARNGGQAA